MIRVDNIKNMQISLQNELEAHSGCEEVWPQVCGKSVGFNSIRALLHRVPGFLSFYFFSLPNLMSFKAEKSGCIRATN
jgi:hypothetical protein